MSRLASSQRRSRSAREYMGMVTCWFIDLVLPPTSGPDTVDLALPSGSLTVAVKRSPSTSPDTSAFSRPMGVLILVIKCTALPLTAPPENSVVPLEFSSVPLREAAVDLQGERALLRADRRVDRNFVASCNRHDRFSFIVSRNRLPLRWRS